VGGVLKRCWVLLEWECGNKLGGGEISFVTLLILRLGLGHMKVSGMIGGVEIDL
jgi:hypothetical protein